MYSQTIFDYLTGDKDLAEYYYQFHNLELEAWIINQPDNSILPHQLFGQAAKLSEGDIYLALVSIHEVLRNRARSTQKWTMVNVNMEHRNDLFDKLVDIRGDLAELGGAHKGDHYGTWYRLWILMIQQMSVSPDIGEVENRLNLSCNTCIGVFAEVVKVLMTKYYFSDKRKIEINIKGAKIGYYLNELLRSPQREFRSFQYLFKENEQKNCSAIVK